MTFRLAMVMGCLVAVGCGGDDTPTKRVERAPADRPSAPAPAPAPTADPAPDPPTPQQEFWEWFESTSPELLEADAMSELFQETLSARLQAVHPDLVWEVNNDPTPPRELIISAGGLSEAAQPVRDLVAAAPALPDWTFVAFRQPGSLGIAIRYGAAEIDADSIWVQVLRRRGDAEALPKLKVGIVGFDAEQESTFQQIGFLFLDRALGEEVVMTGVGEIEFGPPPDDPAAEHWVPIAKLSALLAQGARK